MVERTSVDPQIHFGKSCVKLTLIEVPDVLELDNAGIDFEIIVSVYYPDGSVDDVHACI